MADSMTQTAKTADVVTEGPFVAENTADQTRRWVVSAPHPYSDTHRLDVARGIETEADARLFAASANTFRRHFSDPITAAESDWIARAVAALRVLRPANLGRVPDSMRDDETLPVDMTIREIRMIDAILSQAREVKA